MRWVAGKKHSPEHDNRQANSNPCAYTLYKDGSTYYAECNVPNGSDFEETTFQSAITKTIDAKLGPIYIKNGTYDFSQIVYRPDTQLIGEDMYGVVLNHTGSAEALTAHADFVGTSWQKVGITDLTVKCNSDTTVGILLQNTQCTDLYRVLLKDVEKTAIKLYAKDGSVLHNFLTRVIIRPTTEGDIKANSIGIHLLGGTAKDVSMNVIDRNLIVGMETGIKVENGGGVTNMHNRILYSRIFWNKIGVDLLSSKCYLLEDWFELGAAVAGSIGIRINSGMKYNKIISPQLSATLATQFQDNSGNTTNVIYEPHLLGVSRIARVDNAGKLVAYEIPYKAGVPSDSDFTTTPRNGTLVLDTTNKRIYFRVGSDDWDYAALT